MLKLKVANLEDAKAEYEALCKLPASENGFNNDWSEISLDDFKRTGITKIIANSEGRELPEGYVPCSIYFLWDNDKIVGTFHFRHHLCDTLRKHGGHIGYAILPEFRNQGYATRGLKLLIDEVQNLVPEDELWLDAKKDNIASQKVMLKNGAYITNEDDELVHMRIPIQKDNIVAKIKELILRKSHEYYEKDPGKYDFWNGHLKYVYREATNLAEKYDANIEIVQLGALLHDIAQIERGEKKDHEIYGREIAEHILREYNYPEDKLQRVLGCVLHHRSSKNAENLEELCVADADILAHFDNVPMLFDSAYSVHKIVGLANVRKYMRETFAEDFDDLSDRTRTEFAGRYKTIVDVVLGDAND